MKKLAFFLALTLLMACRLAAQTTTLFPFNSTWKYLDNGTDQGKAWRAPAFEDQAWKSGKGKFGYGHNDEATLISFGADSANKYTTTYFRKALDIDNPLVFSYFTGRVKRDDGVVVYVNGKEVYRNNMPAGTIDYQTFAITASDHGTTALPFTINTSAFVRGTNLIAVEVHQTNAFSFDMAFDMELVGSPSNPEGDKTPPSVLSLNRQMPAGETTNTTSVIFRLTFSEPVTGVDLSDFQLASGVGGTITAINPIGSDGSTYDITVKGLSGTGTLGLNLKSSGTGIVDAANNAFSGGFTGQTYTINQDPANYGFTSITHLEPIASRISATKGIQQAKVFSHAGKQWAVISSTGGTYLYRLDGASWTNTLRLSSRNSRADCVVDGNVTHILLFVESYSELVSLEYNAETKTYQPWSGRSSNVDLVLDAGAETASLALDGTGRMWLASDGTSDSKSDIRVRYSDAPYTNWSAPITIASGVGGSDVGVLVPMPRSKQIGLFWSNQVSKRFGFRTHADGDAPEAWSDDEVPAARSAPDAGSRMAGSQFNIKVGQDGTLYCAVRTSFTEAGLPRLGLLIRRPRGSWDPLYGISEKGSAPMVVLNEEVGKLRVIYSSQPNGGQILYRESRIPKLSFGQELSLMSGMYDFATSAHQRFVSQVVILASNDEQTAGVLAFDDPAAVEIQEEMEVFPNPFDVATRVRFALPAGGAYTLTLLNSMGQTVSQQQGSAQAGKQVSLEVVGTGLSNGIYFLWLQTPAKTEVIRVLVQR